jgi:hypothetical protein
MDAMAVIAKNAITAMETLVFANIFLVLSVDLNSTFSILFVKS